jgi:hypothetical protein
MGGGRNMLGLYQITGLGISNTGRLISAALMMFIDCTQNSGE